MEFVHDDFHWIDWAVIAGYLLLTTFVGHMMRGQQGTIKDFFLGGKSLPWPAVSGSMIATEISGVTFIGVAGTLFALNGNFSYLLWGIGSIMGRVLVAKYFVPKFFEQEIFSPYDYMKRRIGGGAKTLATVIFTVGSILGQSVRVYVAALPLQIVTGMNIGVCVVIIGILAIIWTLMGGMRTVIWTDVMQFFLFTFGGILTLVWIIGGLNGGWGEFWETANLYARFDTWDARLEPHLSFTIWVAIIAVPFQNMTAFGVDQLNAQRMFCCKDKVSAQKALVWSSVGQLLTLMMLLVGAALVVHYDNNPFTAKEAVVAMKVDHTQPGAHELALEKVAAAPRLEHPEATAARVEYIAANPSDPTAANFTHEKISTVPVPANKDGVFPMWIVTVLPVGLSGLILAGVFAAAISSLDSILAALSQTTISLIYHPETKTEQELKELKILQKSKVLVVIWGIILTLFTFAILVLADKIPVLPLAFGLTAYTMGPLLGIFLCAFWGRGSTAGLVTGVVLSFLMVMFVRTDIWLLLHNAGMDVSWLAQSFTYKPTGGAFPIASIYNFAWMWPITTVVTILCGLLIPRKPDQGDE